MSDNTFQKCFGLLRPFDLEAARGGDPICWCRDGEKPRYFIVTPAGNVLANFTDDPDGENLWPSHQLRMAPLCWVEGKPVYKGDVLYRHGYNHEFKITGYEEKSGGLQKPCLTYDNTREYVEKFTWTPPKAKSEWWVNVYPGPYIAPTLHKTKAEADRVANEERIACIKIELERN